MNKFARFLCFFLFLTSSLTAQLGSIEVFVLDAGTGLPLEDVFVIAESFDQMESGFTDASGEIFFTDLLPGLYTVLGEKSGYEPSVAIAIVFADDTAEVFLLLFPIPDPPSSIEGTVLKNRFLTQTDRINKVTWTASPSEDVVEYNLYRNEILIRVIPASAELEFIAHNQPKAVTVYSVTAVNELEIESEPVSVTLD